MNLLIVESPTKARKIQPMLGNEWIVRASMGHVRDLPKNGLSVDRTTFAMTYEVTKPDVIRELKKAVAQTSQVFLATDPDREGEAIAWHLEQLLGLRNSKRVEFHEITAREIRSAVQTPRLIDMPRVRAQEARRALDRLVGYRVSPVLSDLLGKKASAGRVQTPALMLVVDRDRAIANFTPVDHFGVRLTFEGGWTADWDFSGLLSKGPDAEKLWLDPNVAGAVARVRDVIVVSCENTESKKSPPPPFETSTFQRAVSNRFKIGLDAAMKIAQRLFESGAITYMRTDNPNMSTEAIERVRDLAKIRGLPVPDEHRRWKTPKEAQEAHEAIRPTDFTVEEAGESDIDRQVYRMIWARAVASQLADATYAVRTIILEGPAVAGKPLLFKGRGRTLIAPGHLALVAVDDTDESTENEPNNPIPYLAARTPLRATDGVRLEKKTAPPATFTEASLVEALKKSGVGRPSTYASIVHVIQIREYVTINAKRQVTSTTLGGQAVDAMRGRFSFADLAFTAKMEEGLDAIAEGQLTYDALLRVGDMRLSGELEALQTLVPALKGLPCPLCDGGFLRRRIGTRGAFWGCDRHDAGCKAIFDDADGAPDFAKAAARAAADAVAPPCPVCTVGKLRAHDGRNGRFWSCSRYKEANCKAIFDDADGAPDFAKATARAAADAVAPPCPVCTVGKLRAYDGKNGRFWSCSRYKEASCKAIFDDADGTPDFAKAAARAAADAIAPTCKICNSGKLRKRTAMRGDFWGCSHYPDCTGAADDIEGAPDLDNMRGETKKKARRAAAGGTTSRVSAGKPKKRKAS